MRGRGRCLLFPRTRGTARRRVSMRLALPTQARFVDALRSFPLDQRQRQHPQHPNSKRTQLREHEARLASLVDAISARHAAGFARAAQAYSRILQHFGDAGAQVEGLKRSLADAHRQLALQTRHLHQQWRKSLTLDAQTKLLADVQLAVDAPARVDEALASEDWAAAVAALQEAASRLARDSLRRVLALRKVRADVAASCAALQGQLLQELHRRVYEGGSIGPLPLLHSDGGGGGGGRGRRAGGRGRRRGPVDGARGAFHVCCGGDGVGPSGHVCGCC